MKKLLLILLLATPFMCAAQTTPADTAQKPHEQYCMIIATAKFLSTKVNISVDFGQETTMWHRDERIKDETGQVIEFNSVIDALNYMSLRGWIFVNAYALSEGSYGKVLNYVMRKPPESK